MRFLEAAPYRACASRVRKIFDSGFALPRLRYAGTSVAIAFSLTISAPSSAIAQAGGAAPAATPAQGGRGAGAGGAQGGGRGGRGGAALYTPAAGAKDLRAVLFNWAWYTGMLRSSEERDLLMSFEYQGKGTMQVDGQPCNVTKYRTSISYQTSGERIQITGTRPGEEDDVDNVGERYVHLVRRLVVAPAQVHPHVLGWDVAHGVIQRLDMQLRLPAELLDR